MKPITLNDHLQLHTTTIDNTFIDQYFTKASGEQLKVMIMIMRLMQSNMPVSVSVLAQKLDMTESAINRCLSFWEQEGMIGTVSSTPEEDTSLYHAPEKKQLTSAQLRSKSSDETFMYLKYLADMYLKHPMTNAELNSLSYIYDTLKLPVDLIEYLIEYCVSNHKTSFRYIEKVALSWHEKGIMSPAQAKQHAASYQKEYYQIMKAMGLSGSPISGQIEFMERWIYTDAHPMNLILEACKRAVMATGKPSFHYADSILKSWKKNGIHTIKDVLAADQRYNASKEKRKTESNTTLRPKAQQQIHNFNERSYNFDELEQRYIEKINDTQ